MINQYGVIQRSSNDGMKKNRGHEFESLTCATYSIIYAALKKINSLGYFNMFIINKLLINLNNTQLIRV